MKNKFLLLGATALLSTGLVMNVMADDEPSTTTLNVSVELLAIDSITRIQDINFGMIAFNADQIGQHFTATMDPATGNITGIESYQLFGDKKNGQVALAYDNNSKKTIQVDDHISLYDLDEHSMTLAPRFVETYSNCKGPFCTKTYAIGGTLQDNLGIFPGKYTGELTITVIADTGN